MARPMTKAPTLLESLLPFCVIPKYSNFSTTNNNIFMTPQFRSIIPCEILLYIEVTFLGFIH